MSEYQTEPLEPTIEEELAYYKGASAIRGKACETALAWLTNCNLLGVHQVFDTLAKALKDTGYPGDMLDEASLSFLCGASSLGASHPLGGLKQVLDGGWLVQFRKIADGSYECYLYNGKLDTQTAFANPDIRDAFVELEERVADES